MSVPHQKHIIIKKSPCDKNNIYAMINIDTLKEAMNNLSGEAFKLWVYFSKNQEDFQFDLSQKEALKWGLKKSQYYKNIEKLIEKGYLQQRREDSNIFYFTELPFSENGIEFEKEKESEKETYIISENWKDASENRNEFSDFQQRNNTNITEIKQIKKGDKDVTNYEKEIEKMKNKIEDDYYIYDQRQMPLYYQLHRFLLFNDKSADKEKVYNEVLQYYNAIYNNL